MDIAQDSAAPEALLSDFVESYWMIENLSGRAYEIVILPDGRVDLICSYSDNDPFEIRLMGLDDAPSRASLVPGTKMFSVSFKLTAMEYVFHHSVSDLLNNSRPIQNDSWNFTKDDLSDFKLFCARAAAQIKSKLRTNIDPRKKKLFDMIYSSKGSKSVAELADHAGWSSRQINRYFTEWFGISLKTYCNILRFRASFHQLKEGKLFPEKDFADQAHFIKEIKRFSGVKPRDLAQNKDDRFIQFSTLRKK